MKLAKAKVQRNSMWHTVCLAMAVCHPRVPSLFLPCLSLVGMSCGHHAASEPVQHRTIIGITIPQKTCACIPRILHRIRWSVYSLLPMSKGRRAGKGSKNYKKDRQIQFVITDAMFCMLKNNTDTLFTSTVIQTIHVLATYIYSLPTQPRTLPSMDVSPATNSHKKLLTVYFPWLVLQQISNCFGG